MRLGVRGGAVIPNNTQPRRSGRHRTRRSSTTASTVAQSSSPPQPQGRSSSSVPWSSLFGWLRTNSSSSPSSDTPPSPPPPDHPEGDNDDDQTAPAVIPPSPPPRANATPPSGPSTIRPPPNHLEKKDDQSPVVAIPPSPPPRMNHTASPTIRPPPDHFEEKDDQSAPAAIPESSGAAVVVEEEEEESKDDSSFSAASSPPSPVFFASPMPRDSPPPCSVLHNNNIEAADEEEANEEEIQEPEAPNNDQETNSHDDDTHHHIGPTTTTMETKKEEEEEEERLSVSPPAWSSASQPPKQDNKVVGTNHKDDDDDKEERNEVLIHLPPHLASHKEERSSTVHAVVVSPPHSRRLHPEQQHEQNEKEEEEVEPSENDQSSKESPSSKTDQDMAVADQSTKQEEEEDEMERTNRTAAASAKSPPIANSAASPTTTGTGLHTGCPVRFTKGTYLGQQGRVLRTTDKKVWVQLDTPPSSSAGTVSRKPVCVMQASVEPIPPQFPPNGANTTTTTTTTSVPTNGQQRTLGMGCLVEIVGGVHVKDNKGFHGRVTKLTKDMVEVLIQDKEITIRKTSVRVVVNQQCPTTSDDNSTTRAVLDTEHSEIITKSRAPVVVQTPSVQGLSKGQQKSKAMNLSSVPLRRSARKQSAKASITVSNPNNSRIDGTPLQDMNQNSSIASGTVGLHSVPDNAGSSRKHAGGTCKQPRVVTKRRLETPTGKNPKNFLEYWFGDRLEPLEIPITDEEALNPIDMILDVNGAPYEGSGQCLELLSTKVVKDRNSSHPYRKPDLLQLYYINIDDEGHTLQDELNGLANFSALPTSKAVARLELLQSLCCQNKRQKKGKKEKISGIHELARDKFELLPTEGNDGCGFICEEYLKALMTESGVGASAESEPCQRVLAIQVRAVIPTLGIFKGMLIRKRIPRGEAPIQFTPSMQKVGPSLSPISVNTGVLWVTQAGVDPSQFSQFMGRHLDPNLKDPPVTFDKLLREHKLLKEEHPEDNMILSLWKALGVSWEKGVEYSKQSLKREGIKHSYVRGLSDPTDEMPPGTGFVTGLHKATAQQSVFVTRSPCLVPEDGRVLPHLSEKPPIMSDENWEWLNELPFGAIIFANASEGMKPLPTHIAKGDLDGDLYFVCWSKEILSQLYHVEPIDSNPSINKPMNTSTLNNDWLSKAQEQMTDMNTLVEQDRLISVLWGCSKKVAKDNPEDGARHSDAKAYGYAYHESLDIGKHGGKVPLPLRLHAGVEKKYHPYLESA